MNLRFLRLSATLLPAALLLHEAAYALRGGSLLGAHGYLELLVPLAAALAASLALAAVLLPALGVPGRGPARHAPLALAAALLGIFAVQELAEALLLGGGMSGLAASASVAWLAPPLALVLGAIASALALSLGRVGERLASSSSRRRTRSWPEPLRPRPPLAPTRIAVPCGGLAFGFARRPPPARA